MKLGPYKLDNLARIANHQYNIYAGKHLKHPDKYKTGKTMSPLGTNLYVL